MLKTQWSKGRWSSSENSRYRYLEEEAHQHQPTGKRGTGAAGRASASNRTGSSGDKRQGRLAGRQCCGYINALQAAFSFLGSLLAASDYILSCVLLLQYLSAVLLPER